MRTCNALSPEYFICTLPLGHDGDHVAEGYKNELYPTSVEVLRTWPQDEVRS